jgi:hypothetical protein
MAHSAAPARVSTQPPVRLLLDEMFSPAIAKQLRERDHDVVAVADDPQLRAMTDPELMAWGAGHGRRIVTENVRDFRPLIIDDPTGPGTLFTSSRTVPRNKRGVGRLIAAIDAWIAVASKTEQSVEVWLEPASRLRR